VAASCEETMNPFSGKNPNPSVAQSVSDLVAEGGNVLASDDGQTVVGEVGRILPRPVVQHRATLRLLAPLAFAKEGKLRSEAAPSKRSPRIRTRMTLRRVRSANGSS
jgi:hypothetical protein